MQIDAFDYQISPERIAQVPIEPRDRSRLLVCTSHGRLGDWSAPFTFSEREFREIDGLLGPGDLLVMNDAKVLPVRLLGKRTGGGGAVEILLLRKDDDLVWVGIMHLSARVREGLTVEFEPGLVATVISTHEERLASEGEVRLRFSGPALDKISFEQWLENYGHVPLPPYIERHDVASDKNSYQTVYAAKMGSAAAPTAGFHFTQSLLHTLAEKGVETATVTLHVGIGTFRPIKTALIDDHQMHEEVFEISTELIERLERAKKSRKRIVAVGTTVVRALESWAAGGNLRPGKFKTRAYIKPGHHFLVVDDLITNFHQPKSSLLVLVGAAMGVETMREAYRTALSSQFRFFSYGDAMFIRGK